MSAHPATSGCETCPVRSQLTQMGIQLKQFDYLVALAGNPNTGKSSVFNALTGLHQHVGNWPGKTVSRAEGGFSFNAARFKLVDLPGTYSLLSASQDEEIARNFILFGRPDCTIVVVDATALERNLNLALQVLEITDRAVLCVNLMDEAKRKGIEVDVRSLARDLGIPAVPTVARTGEGLHELVQTVSGIVKGEVHTSPYRPEASPRLQQAVSEIASMIEEYAPGIPSARWIAYRLLDGDHRVRQALLSGELAELAAEQRRAAVSTPSISSLQGAQ
jgi:GTPase